ncbi:MAG: PIN domain-containing protein [Nitrososphaeria archaeon]
MKAVIDTRFFVVHFLAEDEMTKGKTRRILEDLQRRGNVGFVPTVVIHELYKFEVENFGIDVAEIRVNTILKSNLKVTDLDHQIAVESAKLRCKYGNLPMADSIIVATAIQTSSEFILTDDVHIKQVREVKTKWI